MTLILSDQETGLPTTANLCPGQTLDRNERLTSLRPDILIALALSVLMVAISQIGANKIPQPIVTDLCAQDVWFGSDIPTVFSNMTSQKSDFGRNNKHPLFPLIAFPPTKILMSMLHLPARLAAQLVISLAAALWIALLFLLFRLIGCHRLDSVLFSLVGATSASALFWFSVPETFALGSITILIPVLLVALSQRRRVSSAWYVGASALSLSITITNWIAGLTATTVNYRWRKALWISCLALCAVGVLWIPQRAIFAHTGFPFQPRTFVGEQKFMSAPSVEGSLSVVSSFLFQTIVMPAVRLVDFEARPGWPMPIVDTLAPYSGGVWGTVAVAAWTGLLGLGVWGFCVTRRHANLRLVVGVVLAAQLLLHLIYGVDLTFIYSLHFLPLLLTIAAFSVLTRARVLGLGLAAVLAVCACVNNWAQFDGFTEALGHYGPTQDRVCIPRAEGMTPK